jgi:hypothetical protein
MIRSAKLTYTAVAEVADRSICAQIPSSEMERSTPKEVVRIDRAVAGPKEAAALAAAGASPFFT